MLIIYIYSTVRACYAGLDLAWTSDCGPSRFFSCSSIRSTLHHHSLSSSIVVQLTPWRSVKLVATAIDGHMESRPLDFLHNSEMSEDKIATVRIAYETPDTLTLRYEEGQGTKQISSHDVIAFLPLPKPGDSEEEGYTLVYLQHPKAGSGELKDQQVDATANCVHVRSPARSLLEQYCVPSLPKHLDVSPDHSGHCSFHVIVSVKSGTCQADSFFVNVVQKVLNALGFLEQHYKVHKTTSERFIKEFTRDLLCPRANRGIHQTVLLLSGDGGVVDMINAMLQVPQSHKFVKPTIGLIAMGTGNALANSTGLNSDSTKGLRSFLRGTPHSLPTFTAKFSPGSVLLTDEGRQTEPLPTEGGHFGVLHGAVVCSWALHASLVADSDTTEHRKYGAERFQMAAKELMHPTDGSKPHTYKGRVTLFRMSEGGREYPEYLDRAEHMYILATLVSNLEQKFRISPRSRPLDGQLRLLHFGALPSDEIMRIIGMAFTGGDHIKEPAVGYQTLEAMRIDLEEADSRWRRICVDGKIVQVGEGGWVEARKESHDVLDLVVDFQRGGSRL